VGAVAKWVITVDNNRSLGFESSAFNLPKNVVYLHYDCSLCVCPKLRLLYVMGRWFLNDNKMKIYRKKTTKTYYDVVGRKTKKNLYGKSGSFVKVLQTDGNGRKFNPNIVEEKYIDYSSWDKITKNDLPKVLKVSFDSFKDWI